MTSVRIQDLSYFLGSLWSWENFCSSKYFITATDVFWNSLHLLWPCWSWWVMHATYIIGNQQKKKNKFGVVLGQNMGQIRSSVMKKVNKLALSIYFFHIFHILQHLLKQRDVRAKFLPNLGQKWQKTDYF